MHSSKLPPRQLPFLTLYAFVIIRAAEYGWIDKDSIGKAGSAIVGVLSMGELASTSRESEGLPLFLSMTERFEDGIVLRCDRSHASHRAAAIISVLLINLKMGRGEAGLGGSPISDP